MNTHEMLDLDKEMFKDFPAHSIDELGESLEREDADDVVLNMFKDMYRERDEEKINEALQLLNSKRPEVAIKATAFMVEQNHGQEI